MPVIVKDLGTFSASHCLPNHDGKCRNLHGHEYKVVVAVRGNLNHSSSDSDAGMVLDFGIIKSIYKDKIESICDHAVLLGTHLPPWYLRFMDGLVPGNDTEAQMNPQELADVVLGKVAHLPIPETTAEFLASWMHDVFGATLWEGGHNGEVEWVQVWETPTSCAQSSR